LGPGVLGFGILAGYQGTSAESYGIKTTSSDIVVSLRGAYHYPVTDAFDAYAGVGLGYRRISYDVEGTGSGFVVAADYSGVYSAGFIGGRYFFSDALGAFAELGYDQAYLKAGLSLKF
jgi:opacity protein-like surface antigen